MLINQHNYEAMFLLYADGELSATDKQAVEVFVQANPGFAEELEILTQLKLDDDPIIYEDKNSLFRFASSEIGLTNYEAYFLLYVDNELDTDLKEKVETFVLQHPAIQEPFIQLKQTRLPIETFVFPDKASLYKKGFKAGPVFYMQFQKLAVAAAVIGLAVLVWPLLPTHVSKQKIAKPSPAINTTIQNEMGELANKSKSGANPQNSPALIAVAGKTDIPIKPVTKNEFIHPKNITVIKQDVPNHVMAMNSIVSNNAIINKEAFATNPVEADEPTQVTTTPPLTNNLLTEANMVKATNIAATNTINNPIQSTVYRELDTEDADKSLYLGSIEINKDKLRGFFRKANNLFRGKIGQEDEKNENTKPSSTRILK